MIRAQMCVVLMAAAIATSACSGDNGDKGTAKPAGTVASTTTIPANQARVVVRGNATLDGKPFDAEFLGAIVRRDGLVTPCQYTLPQVTNGRFTIPVMSEVEASGCGGPGSEILLWTFQKNTQYFSTKAVAWPGNGNTTTFGARFSTATPNGDSRPRTEIAGEIFEQDGRRLPAGTRVEAYIGKTLCGVATARTSGDFTGVSLSIVGPDSVAGCTRGGTVTFRVDGRQAVTTAVNRFRAYRSLDLTLP
jgi:hypothetical protein